MNNTEPLWTVAGITAGVAAVLGLLVAFGLELTNTQQTAILAVATVVAPLVVAWVTRPKVTPNAQVVAVETRTAEPVTVAGEASPLPNGTPVSVIAEPV